MNDIKLIENFQFTNLSELRDWLNHFETTDLTRIAPTNGRHIDMQWQGETLPNGRTITAFTIETIGGDS